MNTPTDTHDAQALELQARSLDALVSLLHALDASNDVDDVAKRALLTLSGQLLVQRSAFFVADEGILQLRATVGVGKSRVTPATWRLPEEIEKRFERAEGGVIDFDSVRDCLEEEIAGNFDRLARLSNGSQTVGVVLLGGWLGSRELRESDRQLLRTMGVVIGTTLHRVTVQEELEKARRRLEQAHLIRKTVMDHVSHEFNTPLMVVKSVGDLLRDAAEEEREGFLDMHAESVERLEELVGSILRVTREVEEGSRPRWMPVREIVTGIIEPWLFQSSEGRSFLHCDASAEDQLVQVDAMRLESILHAVHSNALRASGESSPRVWTNVYAVPRGWWEAQDHLDRLAAYDAMADRSEALVFPEERPSEEGERELVVEVVDVGRGIPGHDLERVFEPFVQASNSSSLGISGAGMGLSSARKLAVELDGRLLLQSREGVGTVVALLLPIGDGADDPFGAAL